MKKVVIGLLVAASINTTFAEETYPVAGGAYIIPDSSIRNPADTGVAYHTFNILFKPNDQSHPDHKCETPASLACVYALTPNTPGCPIASTTTNPSGGDGKTIAIVDAYDNADQRTDLVTYSRQFGLPSPNLTIVGGNSGSSCTAVSPHTHTQDWQDEHTLDLEMVHAMAPNAHIYLVEADSGGGRDMMNAEDCATHLLTLEGGGIVSNSWGGDEFSTEALQDTHFQNHPGIAYVFSSGDYSAPARYPSSSPYVISTGASSILRNTAGDFIGESAWNTNPNLPIGSKSGTSGGPSLYESRPSNQSFVQKIVGTQRGTPDIAFDGDPATGVCVYSTFHGGWLRDGGTSVSAPALSGILTVASYRASTSQDLLNDIYSNAIKNYHRYWNDGIAGNNGYPALSGYDFVTGLGTPRGYEGK